MFDYKWEQIWLIVFYKRHSRRFICSYSFEDWIVSKIFRLNQLVKMCEMFFEKPNHMNIHQFPGMTSSLPYWHHSINFRFVELLSLLVNEPGNSKLTQQYLPTIIELCTTALYPAIREVKSFSFLAKNFPSIVLEFLVGYSRELL